jgi:ATP-dependent Clp protease ATP-binding subunit ClpC
MVRWTQPAGELPALALEEAERLGHRYLGPEHLLLALLRQEDTSAANLLRADLLGILSAGRTCPSTRCGERISIPV